MGAGLVIEYFGFSGGLTSYCRKKEIDLSLVKSLPIFTVSATVAGVFLGRLVPAFILQIMPVL